MHLYVVPLVFILAGLALYAVLAGADFGAGLWQITAGKGPQAARIRDHSHDSMAPVWEANHVWLIFVITVLWTAYPVVFASIFSTLAIPLFIAALGIIFRGAAYAVRSGTSTHREQRVVDLVFSLSSILTPFALGAVIGAIVAGRVPVGNASGDALSSWLGPLSLVIGALAVASAAYLAAVYLSADAVRVGDPHLAGRFRARALVSGAVAGVLAIAGLAVLDADAQRIYHRLVAGPGLPALIVSVLAGLAALALVWRRRYAPARYVAALAVAAILAGWALAQEPIMLPGLTVREAAAPHDVLVAVVVAVVAGGAILFPSLALLFRLLLGGQLDHGDGEHPHDSGATVVVGAPRPIAAVPETKPGAVPTARPRTDERGGAAPVGPAGTPATDADARRAGIIAASTSRLPARLAVACAVAGVGFLTVADASWAHALGVLALVGVVVFGFLAVAPTELAGDRYAPALSVAPTERDEG